MSLRPFGFAVSQMLAIAIVLFQPNATRAGDDATAKQLDAAENALKAGNTDFGMKQLRELATRGSAEAQYRLGTVLRTGLYVKADTRQAAELLTRAATAGHQKAILDLSELYEYGIGVEENPDASAKWLQKAATAGNIEAAFRLSGLLLGAYAKTRQPEGLKWATFAAEHGHLKAQRQLAVMYHKGRIVKKNPVLAFKWFSKAAEQGDAKSIYRIGEFYEEGVGVKVNYAEAAKWFRKATGKEDYRIKAYQRLAYLYANGLGVPKDLKKADQYMKEARAGRAREARMNREMMSDD